MSKKLPPLSEVDKDLHLGESFKTELKEIRCNHELELVSGTEARCKKCPVGWSGAGISRLVEASLS